MLPTRSPALPPILGGLRIKWARATRTVPRLPLLEALLVQSSEVQSSQPLGPPRAGDVVLAEVLALGEHRRLELADGRRSVIFPGDLVGLVYGFRNPGRREAGVVPVDLRPCQLLTPGGLCGELLPASAASGEPRSDATLLAPRARIQGPAGPVNLAHHALRPRPLEGERPVTLVAVGSGAGSGKTRAASALVHGLVRAGLRVAAGKPCGTASARDVGALADAGAAPVLDFTDAGHASTARCSPRELCRIVEVLYTNLCASAPDFLVFELADGIFQRESSVALADLLGRGLVDHVLYAAHDALGVREGLASLRALGARVLAVSGRITCSALAAREAAAESDVPVLRPEDLGTPDFVARLIAGTTPAVTAEAGPRALWEHEPVLRRAETA